MLKLSIEDDEGKTTVVPLTRDEMTVGRQEGNTIRLTERNVSRRHARLSRQNGTLCIEDLSSFTGVRVNGTKIVSPTPLREGDEVQIGDYRITLRGERPSVTDRPTMPTMPVVNGPIGSVGGAMAIPTRASVAAMAAQPAPQAPNPAVPAPRSRTKTSPPQPITTVPPDGAPAAAPAAPVEPALPVEEPVVQAVEAQPTIPLRALADQGLDPDAAAGPAARLVVMTTDLAGLEVALDKASLVIGRTDENDVVLSHRSISRHHAKLVRDGDRYTIVDLQSANGVRVNGEDYERIELNPGDVLELGHVKLRFVGPQEQFVFDGRAAASPRRAPASLLAMAGGALAAVAVVALFWHRGGHRAREATPAPAPVVAAAPVAPPPEPAAVPAPPPAPPPAPAPPATPASLLAAAKESAAAEDWEAAETALVKINGAGADAAVRREAAALIRKVETERQGAALFARFDAAATEKNYAAAVAGYAEIPADSVYKKRARPRYEEARALVIAQHMTAAEAARAEGRCTDVRVEAAQVLRLDPKNLLIRDLSKLCRARPELAAAAAVARPVRTRQVSAVTAADRGEAPRRPEVARGDGAEPAAKGEAADSDDAEALMKQAREAWLRQQCGAAMDLSRRALKAKPGWTDAYQILAVCSCSLKDADAAEHAYARLDDRNRSLVHAVCQKNGISVGQ